MPMTIANPAASSGEIGKGRPQSAVIRARVKAPAPASVSWASETCPAYPVITTCERAMMAKIRLMMTAKRMLPEVR